MFVSTDVGNLASMSTQYTICDAAIFEAEQTCNSGLLKPVKPRLHGDHEEMKGGTLVWCPLGKANLRASGKDGDLYC